MPSSWSSSLRFELQFAGESVNLWGDKANAVFRHVDYAIAGWLEKPLLSTVTILSTNNAGDDEARAAMLKFTGSLTASATVTLPSVSKAYFVYNALTQTITFTTGAGGTVTVDPGDKVLIECDGSNVHTPGYGGLPLKDYIATSVLAATGSLPAATGNANKFLYCDGTNWLPTGLATTSEILAGTSTKAPVTPAPLTGSAAYVQLTDAASVVWDTNTGFNAFVVLAGNRAVAAPSNLKDGWAYTLDPVQDATGSRVLTFDAIFDFGAAGQPVLSTGANKQDSLTFVYKARRSKLEFVGFRKAA